MPKIAKQKPGFFLAKMLKRNPIFFFNAKKCRISQKWHYLGKVLPNDHSNEINSTKNRISQVFSYTPGKF